jgi:phosphogluconate dehydratase
VVQDRGYKVALVTDGRMSGASGKVPAAIHVSPEALEKDGVWGPLALLRDGDVVRVSGEEGTLSTTADLTDRKPAAMREIGQGTGRELFGLFRTLADEAERGASAMLAQGGL